MSSFIKIGGQVLVHPSQDPFEYAPAGAPTRFAAKPNRKFSPHNPYDEDSVAMSEFEPVMAHRQRSRGSSRSGGKAFSSQHKNQHQVSLSVSGLPSIDQMRAMDVEGSKPKQFGVVHGGKKRTNFFSIASIEKFHTKDKYGSRSNRYDY